MSDTPTQSDSRNFQRNFVDRSEIALQKIRDVVTGNTFHPLQDVELVSYEEVFIEFQAHSNLILHTERAERVIPNKPPGLKKINNKNELDTLSAKDIENITESEATLTALKTDLLKREDKGYFWDKQRVPLQADPLLFLREEPCLECRGAKQIECRDCKGRGHAKCPNCKAQGQPNCLQCKGRGEIQCLKCKTKGRKDCHNCRANGKINHVTQIKLFADTQFSYDRRDIPDVAVTILDRLRDKLFTKDHATFKISDDIAAKKKDHDAAMMTLTYDVKLPLGDAIFRVGDEDVPALLFGYKTALLDVPPFLERYMLAPFNLIRQAAQGQGNVMEKVRTAAHQTRLTNQAIIGVATKGVNVTERELKHEYSIALEPGFIHNLVRTTRAALNKLTMKPQIIGLTIGLIPALILTLLYIFVFNSGGINTAQPVRLLLDMVFLLICAFLPYICAQIMTRQTLIYTLGTHMKPHIKLPKLGMRGLWGPVIILTIFILLSASAYRANPLAAPEIYALFRGLIP